MKDNPLKLRLLLYIKIIKPYIFQIYQNHSVFNHFTFFMNKSRMQFINLFHNFVQTFKLIVVIHSHVIPRNNIDLHMSMN